ncbi:lipase family protein [Corynebacterium aquatimens]|uniref:Pimeloyl-ACP methyl ester carboxylesterase n=2 Tax=Corynebacterium aquatimens TaxID=1190508 RepID=A0A931E1Z8_9CORY|nr:lipase family protein [Corynebacterium aquatimens]MBG6122331.1 pimeloyl-ACP methyl ester carboxylesterase [Corynebacterium aquatimens]
MAASSLSSISEGSSNHAGAHAAVPQRPGELIVREKVGGSHGERIRYSTTNERGQIVPVTGAIYDHAHPKGTVVIAPGTRGMGDQCAPSAGSSMLGGINGSSVNINYEAPFAESLWRRGYRVVVTDYIGLGTPGAHTYLNRIDQGHAVIDAARAVVAPGEKVVFYGYSQGGGASAAAAELHAAYAPELNVVGTFSGAAPADPLAVLEQGNDSLAGVAAFVIASYAYSYPEFAAAIGEHATLEAWRHLEAVASACVIEGSLSSGDFASMTRTGRAMTDIARNDPRVREALVRNKLGTVPLSAPMLVLASPQDTIVPFEQTKQMARDYCALGSTVEFRSVPVSEELTRRGISHAVPLIAETEAIAAWVDDRFAGKPPAQVCPA